MVEDKRPLKGIKIKKIRRRIPSIADQAVKDEKTELDKIGVAVSDDMNIPEIRFSKLMALDSLLGKKKKIQKKIKVNLQKFILQAMLKKKEELKNDDQKSPLIGPEMSLPDA